MKLDDLHGKPNIQRVLNRKVKRNKQLPEAFMTM